MDYMYDIRNLEDYRYTSLSPGQVRVFELVASENDDSPVAGCLHHVDLKEVRYEALSYAWGPTFDDRSHLTRPILCNSQKLYVTENLYAALNRLRVSNRRRSRKWQRDEAEFDRFGDRSQPLPVWIDAICIDQANHEERSEQVSKMDSIFQRATVVTVWLGEPSPGSLGELQKQLIANDTRQGQALDAVPPSSTDITPLEAVKSILDLPWFHRRWVIQEVAGNRQYFTLLGDAEGTYGGLYELLRTYNLQASAGPLMLRLKSLSMLQNMYCYDRSECSEGRDRVFALRSLATDGKYISVDYNRRLHDTYREMAFSAAFDRDPRETYAAPNRFAYRVDLELLRLLAMATCKRKEQSRLTNAAWESWLPDWREPIDFESDGHRDAVEDVLTRTWCLDQENCNLPDHVDYLSVPVYRTWRYMTVPGIMSGNAGEQVCVPVFAEPWTADCWIDHDLKQHDRVWIPCVEKSTARKVEPGLQIRGVGFSLVPARGLGSFPLHLVYRIGSCFLFAAGWKVDHGANRPSTRQVLLGLGAQVVHGRFYLE